LKLEARLKNSSIANNDKLIENLREREMILRENISYVEGREINF